jgi:hypothetical protein
MSSAHTYKVLSLVSEQFDEAVDVLRRTGKKGRSLLCKLKLKTKAHRAARDKLLGEAEATCTSMRSDRDLSLRGGPTNGHLVS